jgi:hypothetical protein
LLTVSALAEPPAEGTLIDKVWSGHPVGFDILTERGHQFIAYYDAERRLTVVGRRTGESRWTRVYPEGVMVDRRNRMSNVIGWDSHNYLTMALDREGCLHLSGNMHADPLVYYRTRVPFDLTTLERVDRMTGERETRTTYPQFFNNDTGDLCFRYRDGGSGNGSDLYNIYDPATRTWRSLIETSLLEGEGERSAYASSPKIGPDGRFHMIWMWRETPDALTNNNLSYARSRDLVHWETSQGKPLELPITRAEGEVIDPAAPGEGLINMCYSFGFDGEQRPVAAYHRFDEEGNSQAFVARPDSDGKWRIRQISKWDFRWDFSGNGSQLRQVSLGQPTPDADGNLIVNYSTKKAGSGRWRIDGKTLELLERLPKERGKQSLKPKQRGSEFPGIENRSTSSTSNGTQWVLRWQTLGPNRDLEVRDVPPPSELRLYEIPVSKTGGTKSSESK